MNSKMKKILIGVLCLLDHSLKMGCPLWDGPFFRKLVLFSLWFL